MASQQDMYERAEEINGEFRKHRAYVAETLEDLTRVGSELSERLQELSSADSQPANGDTVVSKYQDAVDSLLKVVASISSYVNVDMPSMLLVLARQLADKSRSRAGIDLGNTDCTVGLSESSKLINEYYISLYDAETAYVNALDDGGDRLSVDVKLGHAVDNARLAMARLYMCADGYAQPQ